MSPKGMFVYYETMKWELNKRLLYECERCEWKVNYFRIDKTRAKLKKVKTRPINVYYETRKREPKRKPNSESRCDERLKTKVEESTSLLDTELFGQLEHLKIKTRLIDEKFPSVMGESARWINKVVYYESRTRELKTRLLNEGRCKWVSVTMILLQQNKKGESQGKNVTLELWCTGSL
jgi:hypothetical protein